MNTEAATIENALARSGNPLDMSPAEFNVGLQRRSANRNALIQWVRQSLVDGVDFGAVPLKRGGYSKPSLRKPGAEKICGMLGVTASFPTLKDYEAGAIEGRAITHVVLRCHLISPDGQIVADGIGARSLDQDHGDLNKCLKMCAKSAHIDATLRMAGLSEIFTQDIEDMPKERLEAQEVQQVPAQPKPAAPAQTERVATDRQVGLLAKKCREAGIDPALLCEKFGVPALEDLPFSKVNPALHWIDSEKSKVSTREPAKPLATDFEDGDIPYSEEEVARYAR